MDLCVEIMFFLDLVFLSFYYFFSIFLSVLMSSKKNVCEMKEQQSLPSCSFSDVSCKLRSPYFYCDFLFFILLDKEHKLISD